MSKKDEALKLALEALERYVKEDEVAEGMPGNEPWIETKRMGETSITALRQALAAAPQHKQQPADEPVAWAHTEPKFVRVINGFPCITLAEHDHIVRALTHPQPADDGWLQAGGLLYRLTKDRRPENRDEINVTMADGSRSIESCTRRASELLDRIRATSPQPAAWVGLTDEEAEELRIAEEFDQWGITEGAFKYATRAIEAKLREKNGGAA